MRRALGSLGVLASVCGAACVTSAPVRHVPPRERAMEVSRVRVESASREAAVVSEQEVSYALRLRQNPGRCGAPEFEVRAYGRWERVWLEASTDALAEELEAWGAEASVGEERVEQVKFTRETRADARGAVWSVLSVREGSGGEGAEVAGVAVRVRRTECL